MFVIAVDAGGTSTRCVVANADGVCSGYAKKASGNPISGGIELAAASVAEGVASALANAGVAGESVAGVTFSMAGGMTTADKDAFVRRLAPLGVQVEPVLVSDVLASFCSGTATLWGYALVAGTGAGAIRVEDGVQAVVADGLGWLLGDGGSGFWIGREVAKAAFADMDGRGPATALTDLVLARLGLDGRGPRGASGRPEAMQSALRLVYAMRPVELAQFADLAFGLPGDDVAGGLVERATATLAHTLRAVAVPGVDGPVVLAGGVLAHNPRLAAGVEALCAPAMPRARFTVVSDGAVGAVVLALRGVGATVDQPVFDTIRRTLATLER